MSKDTALALLQTAAAQCEEESDKFVKQLLDKELPIEAFLEQFMTSRKTMHLRKLKAEKMTELVRRNSSAAAAGGSPYPSQPANTGFYPQNVPYPAAGGNMPYPMANMHMPMPGQYSASTFYK